MSKLNAIAIRLEHLEMMRDLERAAYAAIAAKLGKA